MLEFQKLSTDSPPQLEKETINEKIVGVIDYGFKTII